MKWWKQNAKRFMNLQVRERKLIFYSTQVIIIWLAGVLLIEPLIQQMRAQSKQNQASEQQIQRIQQQSALIQRALNADLNEQVRAQISEQQRIEQELVQKIQQMTGSYISANQMLGLLEALLVQIPDVELVALENLPAQPVFIGGETSTQPLLYQHKTRLVFNGNFASLQRLLGQLQQLSWHLHWMKLDYKVLKYPEAQLELELATVSENANYVQI